MAASDQTYRKQNTLDIVFAVSSVLMLVSVVLMFGQDYYRPWKEEQRVFRDVEATVAQRMALTALPSKADFDRAKHDLDVILKARAKDDTDKLVAKIKEETETLRPKKEISDAAYQAVKGKYDSITSFVKIETDHGKRDEYVKELQQLTVELAKVKKTSDDYDEQMKVLQNRMSEVQTPLLDAQARWKKLNDAFEAQAKLAINKEWTIWDSLRDFPVIDGFASPVKIHQLVINDVLIDYNLARVKRFDRCTTCHLGIDRPAYTKDVLRSLLEDATPQQKKELKAAQNRLRVRRAELEKISPKDAGLIPDPDRLELTRLSPKELTDARIKEFCAHPRQHLFVDSNSKHPAERFGCTSCHEGQGAGTTFTGSFHSPNNSAEHEKWLKEYSWGADKHTFLWDYPMLPMRFVESSCLKCHHQVTDLYSSNNRNEAPKLLRGYNLIRENGCFGCHEIQGRKEGRAVGPDLRIEPTPPLEDLTPKERHERLTDMDNLPGNQRKVGPSLFRLAEKTNREWTLKWLRSPRSFRPDTRMPHFYGLENNDPEKLPEGQKKFPDAEMQAITYYLFHSSEEYLKELKTLHPANEKEYQQQLHKEQQALDDLIYKPRHGGAEKDLLVAVLGEPKKPGESEADYKNRVAGPLSMGVYKEGIAKLRRKVDMRKAKVLTDIAPGYKGDPEHGRLLFSEKGCLACHMHHGTESKQGSPADLKTYAPAMMGEAQFAPNLSQITAKLGKTNGDQASAGIWLRQWIKDPHVHSPRSKMPVTHLNNHEAADVAAWLLAQKPEATMVGKDWDKLAVPEADMKDYQDLARVYLKRLLPVDYMEKFLKHESLGENVIRDLPADEQYLYNRVAKGGNYAVDDFKYYLGKKTVGRMGCFGCHDIPNFDSAKLIGVGLMDWGKKKPEKLAFEDIAQYIAKSYAIKPSMKDEYGKPWPAHIDGKQPYEKFFADSAMSHERIGFLYQKLIEPRSYDYNRDYAWDDRSRMPQFRFARTIRKSGESEPDFAARKWMEEAEGREAVMTFVLGLVADPVLMKSINQPTGDRLAEVKGRQVIDKFNCAGCHLIRPGVIDFRLTTEGKKLLDDNFKAATADKAFHDFPRHYNWSGHNPASPDRLTAQGLYNFEDFYKRGDTGEPTDEIAPDQKFKLVHALRFPSLKANTLLDIPAAGTIEVPLNNLIYPPPSAFSSKEAIHSFLHDQGPLGGAYANLLMKYLAAKGPQPRFGTLAQGISDKALASGPPSLIGQGERTQTAWLARFLLDPQPIRGMAVLRMPRFNMSPDEAQALAAYFAALSRLQNTGVEIDYPTGAIPQQEDFDNPYWLKKNQEYVQRLKEAKAPGDPKGRTLYEVRLEQLRPFWEGKLDAPLKAATARLKAAREELEKTKKNPDLKDTLVYLLPALEKAIVAAEENEAGWKNLKAEADNAFKPLPAAEQEKQWVEKYAYVTDAYRLGTKICVQCHQVGSVPTNNVDTPGPHLANVYKRLRPGWTERWIAAPQRFLHYPSIMPINFPANAGNWQDTFAGPSIDQVTAVRDLLMAFPRIEAMPINRYWALYLPEEAAKEKNKKKPMP